MISVLSNERKPGMCIITVDGGSSEEHKRCIAGALHFAKSQNASQIIIHVPWTRELIDWLILEMGVNDAFFIVLDDGGNDDNLEQINQLLRMSGLDVRNVSMRRSRSFEADIIPDVLSAVESCCRIAENAEDSIPPALVCGAIEGMSGGLTFAE